MSAPAQDVRLKSVEEALEAIDSLAIALPSENVQISSALGRCLAAEIRAARTIPPWDNSAMDGYAVRSADVSSAPKALRITQTILAGHTPTVAVDPGTCARIMTGAPLPSGADAVVMQERSRPLPDGWVEIQEPATPRQNVRAAGEDARQGEALLPEGAPLGLPEAGLLWGQGFSKVVVPRRPRVALLSTGDELCPVDAPEPGRLVDTNGPVLAEAVSRAGGIPVALGIARDQLESVVERLAELEQFDVVLTSAGVSVGEADVVKDALTRLGVEVHFWRVAIKPGKPLLVGRKGRTLVFGLPGNPTSSLVTFELFVRPALLRMLGHRRPAATRQVGLLDGALKKAPGLAHYVRVQCTFRDGEVWAKPLTTQTSGALQSAARATHLLVFPAEATQLAHGDRVVLQPVSWGV